MSVKVWLGNVVLLFFNILIVNGMNRDDPPIQQPILQPPLPIPNTDTSKCESKQAIYNINEKFNSISTSESGGFNNRKENRKNTKKPQKNSIQFCSTSSIEVSQKEERVKKICKDFKNNKHYELLNDKDPKIAELCSIAGFSTHEVDAEGNCCFESLFFTLKEAGITANIDFNVEKMREYVAKMMRIKREELLEISDEATVDESGYSEENILKIQYTQEYVGETVLLAVSQLLKVKIVVWILKEEKLVENGTFGEECSPKINIWWCAHLNETKNELTIDYFSKEYTVDNFNHYRPLLKLGNTVAEKYKGVLKSFKEYQRASLGTRKYQETLESHENAINVFKEALREANETFQTSRTESHSKK